MEPELTGGTIATMICVPILALFLLVATAACFLAWLAMRAEVKTADDTKARGLYGKTDKEKVIGERRAALGLWLLGVVALAATTVGTWWGMYPWKTEYHHWTPVAGVVDTVDSRLVSTGDKTMEDKFVVKFRGGDAQYGVLDTRAAGLKPGDKLTITCVRQYQWAGTHGYDCNFVSLERAR